MKGELEEEDQEEDDDYAVDYYASDDDGGGGDGDDREATFWCLFLMQYLILHSRWNGRNKFQSEFVCSLKYVIYQALWVCLRLCEWKSIPRILTEVSFHFHWPNML